VKWSESKKQEEGYELWLRKKFNGADLDNNKCLSFQEVMKLIRELNIQMSDSQAKKLFDEANTTRAGRKELEVLDEDEFIVFYFRLLQRPEIEKLFKRLL
jgi:Ca2+-binding EF-hand superfamily protein